MTQEHVKWALQHDWCKRAELLADGSIDITTDDAHGVVTETFKTFKCLKDWAGY